MTEQKSEEVNTKIYARVRQLMPWEPKKVSLRVVGDKIQNKANNTVNEYSFDRVFEPNVENRRVFQTVVIPMVTNVLNGFDAVLIAYGQTGSGKTFSMLGKPKIGIVGLLPMMLEYLKNQPDVTQVLLSGVEAFGHHVSRIELFDLFNPHNQTPSWQEKSGNTSLNMSDATKEEIQDAQHAHDRIVYAHAASHFAPTGKNPESSRGHVTFVATVIQQKSRLESMQSHFVMVDCAGSEGESAFTADYVAMIDKATLMARRLEAGCINTGLSALQIIFNELRVKNELSSTVGNGLRRVLHRYINNRTYLSVLFTLSPSANNARSTESTLKFAVTAGMVKVKPVQRDRKVNLDQLVAELRAHIAEQEKTMVKNDEKIEEMEREIEYAKNPRGARRRGGGDGDGDGDDDGDYDDEEYVDEDGAGGGGGGRGGGQNGNLASVSEDLGVHMTTSTEQTKETISQLHSSADLLAALIGGDDSAAAAPQPDTSAADEKAEEDRMRRAIQEERENANLKGAMEEVIREAQDLPEEPIIMDTTEDYERLKETNMEELDGEDLRGYAMEVASLYEQEKIVHQGLQQSQQIIVDYLQEEYSGLLNYFYVRKIIPKKQEEPKKWPWQRDLD